MVAMERLGRLHVLTAVGGRFKNQSNTKNTTTATKKKKEIESHRRTVCASAAKYFNENCLSQLEIC